MARLNSNYQKLAAGYLFPEITKRVNGFLETHPDVTVMKLGIGNTTEPLTPAVIEGLHNGVDNLASAKTYTGYGEYHGELPIRQALQKLYQTYGVELDTEEFFVSDGAKPDSGNLQSILSVCFYVHHAYPFPKNAVGYIHSVQQFDRQDFCHRHSDRAAGWDHVLTLYCSLQVHGYWTGYN